MERFYGVDGAFKYARMKEFSRANYAAGLRDGTGADVIADLKSGYCINEVLGKYRRIYFDIDSYSGNSPLSFVKQLLKDFCSLYNIRDYKYGITINKGSRHPKQGLHVVLNKQMHWKTMRNAVRNFLDTYTEYNGIIDKFAYNKKQLIRMPYSANGIVNISYTEQEKIEPKTAAEIATSSLLEKHGFNIYDYHRVLLGKLDDLLIQNIDGCQLIKYDGEDIYHPLDDILEERWLLPAYNEEY